MMFTSSELVAALRRQNRELTNMVHRQIHAFNKMKSHQKAIQAASAFGYPYGTLNSKYKKWKTRYNSLTKNIALRLGVPVNSVKILYNFNRNNWRNYL